MPQKITFEQAMTELDEIVRKLENGQIPLEEAIKTYEHGMELKKICEEKLKTAEMKIEKLTLKDGKPVGTEALDEQL
ncbi:MAG: exodeoxyribonuclease VII small subunit [Alphaproteobacteria bacterium]|nr:exodeoxyribonuclease VII small subunit [Alphaproteobacteria bacterium]